jgi:hypothetical protein
MKLNSKNASVLMVAMIFAIIMAIGAASFINVSLGTLKRAHRSFYYNSAMNLAEAGAEEAMWALNNGDWSARDWSGGGDKTLMGSVNSPDFIDANGAKGYFNVRVENATSGAPTITSEAVIHLAQGAVVKKQLRLTARTANLFLPPFTAITNMKLNGGEIDSYDMTRGHYTTAPREFDTTVASPTVQIGDVTIGSPANIYGNVSVGFSSSQSQTFINSIKGELVGPSTTSGAPGVVTSGGNLIDTNRISYDFSQDFPVPQVPTDAAYAMTLPAADANGYIVIGDNSATPTTRVYRLNDITLKTGETLMIVGPVKLVVSGNISISGQAAIVLLTEDTTISTKKSSTLYSGSTAADAEIYAHGSISLSGHGTAVGLDVQATDPARLRVYGTNPSTQSISIGGNGNLGAAVYAPKAEITFNGGGSSGYFAGAVVGDRITVNGNGYRIRFPEQLADVSNGSTYQVTKWAELTNRSDWYAFQ